MKYEKVYDMHYTTWCIGYKCEAGYIFKDSHLAYTGTEVVEGWEVCPDKFGERVFYASTLKQAKKYVEYCINTFGVAQLSELTKSQLHEAIMAQ